MSNEMIILFLLFYSLYIIYRYRKGKRKMAYSSKYNTSFLAFMNRKYAQYKVHFEFIDDYRLWLYYDYFCENKLLYYTRLDKDLGEYSDWQTGKERERRGKLDGGCKCGKN